MSVSSREAWTVLHGMLFGAVFLLAFGGGLAGLYSYRPEWVTAAGLNERLSRLRIGGSPLPSVILDSGSRAASVPSVSMFPTRCREYGQRRQIRHQVLHQVVRQPAR